MINTVYQNVCNIVVKILEMRVPWSSGVQPTIGQVIIFALAAVALINFIRGMSE